VVESAEWICGRWWHDADRAARKKLLYFNASSKTVKISYAQLDRAAPRCRATAEHKSTRHSDPHLSNPNFRKLLCPDASSKNLNVSCARLYPRHVTTARTSSRHSDHYSL
jgi:hypothetical protein